jgi:hypothetical protein
MGAPRFLKGKCEERSLGECHDGFLVAAMAGPRGQLRWEVVRFEKEGREGREDELHGKEKERFLASFVWVLHVILSALLSFSSSPHFFSVRNPHNIFARHFYTYAGLL